MKNYTYILLLSSLFFTWTAKSQKSKKIKFSGSLGLSYDYYNYSAYNYFGFRPRYEPNIFHLNINARLQMGRYLSIPFGINISNRKVSYNLPNIPNENLVEYVQNPRNNIHIDPSYKWFKAHLGSHTPQYSTLTTGDIQIFGLGFSMNPGKFILAANYGVSQTAIKPDILLNTPGAYKQTMVGVQLGYGKEKGDKFVFNLVKIKDDISSINTSSSVGYDPVEGISVSPLLKIKLFKHLIFKTETAVSLYTSNLKALALPSNNFFPSQLNNYITLNSSSVFDFAHNTSLTWKSKDFLLGGQIKYIGPGYMPIGYRNIEKDIIDYKINTGFKLFRKKLHLKGSIGIRTNNINNTTLVSTKRLLASLNVFGKISKQFSFNASYTNFGFNNNQNLPALRIEMINNSFSFSPSYRFKSRNKQHVISMNLSLNNLDMYNVASLSFITTKTQTFNTNYNVIFKNIPLSLGTNILLLKNKSAVLDMSISNFVINAGYKFYNKKIKPSLSIGYMNIRRLGFSADNRFVTKFKLKYKVNKKLSIKMLYTLTNNDYGTIHPGASVTENKAQISINKKF